LRVVGIEKLSHSTGSNAGAIGSNPVWKKLVQAGNSQDEWDRQTETLPSRGLMAAALVDFAFSFAGQLGQQVG
jgi:hypothetical protein